MLLPDNELEQPLLRENRSEGGNSGEGMLSDGDRSLLSGQLPSRFAAPDGDGFGRTSRSSGSSGGVDGDADSTQQAETEQQEPQDNTRSVSMDTAPLQASLLMALAAGGQIGGTSGQMRRTRPGCAQQADARGRAQFLLEALDASDGSMGGEVGGREGKQEEEEEKESGCPRSASLDWRPAIAGSLNAAESWGPDGWGGGIGQRQGVGAAAPQLFSAPPRPRAPSPQADGSDLWPRSPDAAAITAE